MAEVHVQEVNTTELKEDWDTVFTDPKIILGYEGYTPILTVITTNTADIIYI